jgi:hypothetical protein
VKIESTASTVLRTQSSTFSTRVFTVWASVSAEEVLEEEARGAARREERAWDRALRKMLSEEEREA